MQNESRHKCPCLLACLLACLLTAFSSFCTPLSTYTMILPHIFTNFNIISSFLRCAFLLARSKALRLTTLPSCGTRFCLCGLEHRTKSTAAPTVASFIRHRRRSHMLPVRERLSSTNILDLINPVGTALAAVRSRIYQIWTGASPVPTNSI